MGSYSVVQCVRRLMGQPLYCSAAMLACGARQAVVMAPSPTCDSAVCRASMAAWLSSTGISHHNLLPHIPSIHLSAVNSSPLTGIAPQSLNSSLQLLPLPGDIHSCPAYEWLHQGLSDPYFIKAVTDKLFHSQL